MDPKQLNELNRVRAELFRTVTELKHNEKRILLSRRAVLNVLEDLKSNNGILKQKTIELEKTREEILQKNALDEAILSSIGDGLVVVDNEGRITYVNHSFEAMTGWSSAEVLGQYIVNVLPRQDESGAVISLSERIMTRVLAGEEINTDLTNPFYYVRKDGSRFPTSNNINQIVLDGKVIGIVESFRDITRERDIDKSKTEFVSLASHQLRTPLSTINWYTEMLIAGDAGALNAMQADYLDEIYRGNQRMISLVNALLSVSRMSLGTFVLEPKQTDVFGLVQAAVQEQLPQVRKKNITLTNTTKSFPLIETDPKLLNMVVENLLSNAVKYTPENGTITLSVALNSERKTFMFTIADTGLGIPKNQQDKIFTKLFRADNVRMQDTEGTGLGLYIVKAIVDNSGGRVWFESEENVGSTFYFELPYDVPSKK